MAVSTSIIILLLPFFILLQPWSLVTGAGDILAPLLAPIFENVCKQVTCGEGICKPSDNSTIPYECECSPGWKQLATSVDDHHQYFKFLPCVIPNCTLNYSCSEAAPPPVQEKENRGNESFFDVCRWTDCGGGRCESTSLFTHKCECNEGYHNLLNLTFSPCFKECSFGMDCKDLNIGFKEKPSSPPPSLSADRSNQASYRLEGGYDWLIFTFFLLAI
ncbi:hypothetical protein L1987_52133 [Smallanthus sonchifolius]|uniref:Uncharacterized protein n=1 Tax=Smallanthus sonchifolius TaxID=185202 RepID=A0ACB9ETF7_9ASTR|nr:hypothetical protein L1987_52133 [Smallanthus sonchifolius]